jgi:hypothetical protein
MTWVVFWRSATIVGGILALGVWAAFSTTFLFRHPAAPDVRVVIDRRTGLAVVAALADPASGIKPIKPEPRAKVLEKEYDFGLMDPGISGTHSFVIENVGDEVLELKLGGTTCKCTISGVSDSRVPPGKSATLNMQWNTGRYDPRFQQSAMIQTNDPLHKKVEFTVKGQIRALLATLPAQVDLPTIQPGARAEGEVTFYSQMWDDFEITDSSAQVPDFQWTVESVRDAPADLSASACKRVKFSFQSPVAHGRFQEKIRFDIKAPDESQPNHHQFVSVQGAAMRRLAFYGPTIDESGVVEMGNVSEGRGKRVKLVAKVRDDETNIASPDIEVFPDFLKAEFAPHVGEQRGLYDLTIELPDDVSPCQYNSRPVGKVRIDTHHPRIGVVELKVTFAVVPRRSL